jgi:hypothetical protein
VLAPFKEKSWSVLLVRGYILGDQVRSDCCQNCKSTCEVLRVNFGNPNLMLYGCSENKCKHKLLRLDFNDGGFEKLVNS